MRLQLQRVMTALQNKPDGLTILQLTRAINRGLEKPYSSSTVTYWTKEALKLGVIEQCEPVKKRGRPAQIFKAIEQ
ncbi:TPA: hypothetical protein JG872_000361 [Enterobacter hormaechei subsp. xiangfangensis]|nr:hypothetical protein [Enterobacter hormaechei subsp. xiangfangensis]HAV1860667.1 hypothetical protein [Enterobacter hormaechei subsp. xiangfangensis]